MQLPQAIIEGGLFMKSRKVLIFLALALLLCVFAPAGRITIK